MTTEQQAQQPVTINGRELAEYAYEGYRSETGGKSAVTGAFIPPWHETTDAVRNAWRAATLRLIQVIGYPPVHPKADEPAGFTADPLVYDTPETVAAKMRAAGAAIDAARRHGIGP